MQGFHLPHRKSSLKEGRTLLYRTLQNFAELSLQSNFPTKVYQPEEDPTKGEVSDKDVECFLCLVVIIINSEKVIILHISKKVKTETVAQK